MGQASWEYGYGKVRDKIEGGGVPIQHTFVPGPFVFEGMGQKRAEWLRRVLERIR